MAEEVKSLEVAGNRNLPEPSTIFFDVARFEAMWKIAGALSKSNMLPAQFQNNTANCIIALNLADRLRVDPFMMMQSMYVVHGRPGIEGKLAIPLIDGTGRFSPIKYKFSGEGKTEKGIGRPGSCIAYATELKTGEVIEGPPVTWEMAAAEGWTKNKGTETSKWQTLPDLMFRYRAAMFFARVNCPGALLGLRSVDEIEDIEALRMVEGANGVYNLEPGQQGGTEASPPPEETKEAFEKTIPAGTDMMALSDYLLAVAKANKITVLDVQTNVVKEEDERPAREAKGIKKTDGFWDIFPKWSKTQQKKASKKPQSDADLSSGKLEMAPAPCPDRPDTVMTVLYCNTECKTRQGCQAWPVTEYNGVDNSTSGT